MTSAEKWNLPVSYGDLTQSDRRSVREQYAREQGGKCRHCGGDLWGPAKGPAGRVQIEHRLFPESFFRHPIHLHHSHKTGLTIGAVHSRCNAYLWQYRGE